MSFETPFGPLLGICHKAGQHCAESCAEPHLCRAPYHVEAMAHVQLYACMHGDPFRIYTHCVAVRKEEQAEDSRDDNANSSTALNVWNK